MRNPEIRTSGSPRSIVPPIGLSAGAERATSGAGAIRRSLRIAPAPEVARSAPADKPMGGTMDLGDPLVLISGFLIGGVGFVLLVYGKKEWNLKCLATGLVMCV